MSKYTTELKNIIGFYNNNTSTNYSNTDIFIENARSKIFNFDYPLSITGHKKILETKILKHYFFREIAFETMGMWQFKLNTKMNEIMNYYNELYKTELIKIEPLITSLRTIKNNSQSNNKSELNGTNTSNTSNSSNTVYNNNETINNGGTNSETTKGKTDTEFNENYGGETNTNETSKFSDTPQGSISSLEDDSYLTNATINNGNTTNNGERDNSTHTGTESNTTLTKNENTTITKNNVDTNSSNSNVTGTTSSKNIGENLSESLEKIESIDGSQAELLMKYRESILNIDMMIINELSELFLKIW